MNSIVKPSSTSSHTYSYHKLLNFNPNTNPFYRSVSYISFKVFRKKSPKRPLICASCNNFPHNLISLVTPVWENIRNFSANAAKKTWVSSSTLNPVTDNIVNDQKTQFLYNGGIGMALLSVKSTAQDRFSPVVAALANNPTFVCGFLALFLAQSIKVMLNFVVEREWNMRKLCTSGGMPSSHSALCTALTTSVALCHGVADSLFPVCLGFSVIVMYDAIGVRRHAGMQAEVLNKIIEDLFQGHPISERKLKELLGHTPLQVFAGALLGIAVAWYCCQGFLVRI